ncbi:AAA family ATPase [Pseudodesulfovibrio tunisiensis]|uniref:AAA family ATPase n=1 Tax=Pseudodesulfovibrio tunisiensis TaxID=463192 RepID=UPI001FB35253|nr:ATP-binding protein [Pseudodesulfovibrio tunisiensis]
MLLEFTVGNFRSFGEKQTLFMQPARKLSGYHDILNTGIFREPDALPCAVIYGANASGKSSLLNAFSYLRLIVKTSASREKKQSFSDKRFKLKAVYQDKPSEFDIKFVGPDGKLYTYSLSLKPDQILFEKLTVRGAAKGSQCIELILREENDVRLHKSIHSNKSFLDVWSAEVNKQETFLAFLAKKGDVHVFDPVMDWFSSFLEIPLRKTRPDYTATLIHNGVLDVNSVILKMAIADMNIHGVRVEEQEIDIPILLRQYITEELAKEGEDAKLKDNPTVANTYFEHLDTDGKVVLFDLLDDESEGTANYYSLLGYILMALKNGFTVFADELNRSLHPYLLRKIVQMFTSSKTNPNKAQLIFSTHDTTIMDKKLLRPDEIYFTEKNSCSFESSLFSLAEFKNIPSVTKNDRGELFSKEYLAGNFGAVPNIDWGE